MKCRPLAGSLDGPTSQPGTMRERKHAKAPELPLASTRTSLQKAAAGYRREMRRALLHRGIFARTPLAIPDRAFHRAALENVSWQSFRARAARAALPSGRINGAG